MNVMDVYCHDCFSSTWLLYPYTNIYSQLYMGQIGDSEYFSCLFFHLPPISSLGTVHSVKLYLFNTPSYPLYYPSVINNCYAPYTIYPLSEYVTAYSYNTTPQVNFQHPHSFYANPYAITTEIDITSITNLWLSGTLPNKGLILLGPAIDLTPQCTLSLN